MKKIAIFKHNLLRATLTLALIVTCATAWATDVQTYYIDENGTSHDVTATVLTGGGATTLAAGWYVVNSDISYTGKVTLASHVNIILADGGTMNIGTSESRISSNGIYGDIYTSLTIYRQTAGTGTLNVYSDNGYNGISVRDIITINGGIINANSNGSSGISTNSIDGSITINGGNVNATGSTSGIWSGNLTLGWTNYTDRIYTSSIHVTSGFVTLSKPFSDTDSHALIMSGTVAASTISGKTLRPAVPYLDADGTTQYCADYTVLTGGGSTSLAAGWYVVNSDISYTGSINLSGSVNIILCDGYTISTKYINTDYSHNLTIYGQTNGTGTLNCNNSDFNAISTYGNVSIIGGTVYAKGPTGIFAGGTLLISGGTVTAESFMYAINSNHNVNISGGNVTVKGTIRSSNGTITLGWTNATDRIKAGSYDGTVNIDAGKAFTIDGTDIYTGNGVSISGINKTLLPAVAVTLNDGITAVSGIITSGENHYAKVGQTVTVNTSNATVPEGYTSGVTVTPNTVTVIGNNDFTYSFTMPAEDVTVSAALIPNTYYVHFDGNGNTGGSMSNQTFTYDEAQQLTANAFTCTGYSFNGWSTTSDGEVQYANEQSVSNLTATNGETVTLYAQWVSPIPYIDQNGVEQQCTDYTVITTDDYGHIIPSSLTAGKWYVVNTNAYIYDGDGLNINGNGAANIILCDGKNLQYYTADEGYINGSLNIYGQSAGTGVFYCYSNSYSYSRQWKVMEGNLTVYGGYITITGNDAGWECENQVGVMGNVTMYGGSLDVQGGNDYYLPGGSGSYGIDGNVTMYGGTLNARGGDVTGDQDAYAGRGISGDVTMYGGTLNARGGDCYSNFYEGLGIFGNVTMHGGTLTAQGGTKSDGIFGSWLHFYGGSLTAQGGSGNDDEEVADGIDANVTLDWTSATDRFYASSIDIDYHPTVAIAAGKAFTSDGTDLYSGNVANGNIAGKTLQPCITRAIEGYGNGNDKWAFIASPVTAVDGILPTAVGNIFSATQYDLYRLNPSDMMWENYKHHNTQQDPFLLVNGQGYLYATKETKTLAFIGTFNMDTEKYIENLPIGYNLVGNPFPCAAYINRDYYILNGDGSAILAEEVSTATAISPCYGVVVEIVAEDLANSTNTVTFTTTPPAQQNANNKGNLNIALTQTVTTRGGSSTATLDNAIVSFNEGSQLGKFYFGTQNANIYLPQDGEEYAIVSAGNVGEIPVNFKAHENGTYTLTVSSTLNSQLSTLNFNYLHLIDNMTGADVDLLQTPEYTFNAKVTDYESRFKLVFVCGDANDDNDGGNETFAFYFNGSWIIANEGQATLQVIDLNGRILSSETINGSVSKSINQPAGVYMIRLINGENVMVQKIVVR